MRTLTVAIILLLLTVPSFSQYVAAVPAAANPTVSRVTLELKDTPLKSAIEQVLQFGSADYRLDPALDKAPYDGIMVSIRLVNVPFSEALVSLLNAHGLSVRIEDSVGVIYPVTARFAVPNPNGQAPMVAASLPPQPDLVTVTIPQMPIAEALRYLYRDTGKPASFRFQGRLDMTIMPGATLSRFPRDEAADVLLAAAGLLPPAGNDKLIKSAGAINLSAVISYVPLNIRTIQYGLTRSLPGDFPPAVAVAAYRTANSPNLLLVVLANQEQDIVVLDNILGASGVNYVLGDMTGRPSPEAPAGPRLVSIRLCGVTLQQALQSILPAVNLRYHMQGPTMVIEAMPPK